MYRIMNFFSSVVAHPTVLRDYCPGFDCMQYLVYSGGRDHCGVWTIPATLRIEEGPSPHTVQYLPEVLRKTGKIGILKSNSEFLQI